MSDASNGQGLIERDHQLSDRFAVAQGGDRLAAEDEVAHRLRFSSTSNFHRFLAFRQGQAVNEPEPVSDQDRRISHPVFISYATRDRSRR